MVSGLGSQKTAAWGMAHGVENLEYKSARNTPTLCSLPQAGDQQPEASDQKPDTWET
jgi:hypothetical protein